MHQFRSWLDRVLAAGESVQDAPPRLAPAEYPAVTDRLRAAFDVHALDVPGTPLDFDPDAALRAATALARACWALVSAEGHEPLALGAPATPAANLSADVTLQFLPAAYRRARGRAPNGPLATEIERVLRAWPLSGVLADLDGAPGTEPDFGGHRGLQRLYAERLALTGRAGWVPRTEPARAWAECAFAERGALMPESLPTKEDAGA
ncbi:MAG TPA: hypothetical protein VGE74_30370, partial [Gemmata sp.]